MPVRFAISFAGQDIINRTLQLTLDATADLRPAWKDVSKELNKYEAKMFRASGSLDGFAAWAPLKQSTMAGKGLPGRGYFSRKGERASRGITRIQRGDYPLIRSGKLMRALSKDGAEGALREYDKLFMFFGVDESVAYGKYHQTGTRRMVKRPPLRFSDRFSATLTRIIQTYIEKSGQGVRSTKGAIE